MTGHWAESEPRTPRPSAFSDIISMLNRFWADQGCLLLQPYDTEKGAGTMSPHTVLRAIGPEPWAVAYPEPCRRPTDGRYGDNPNRAQHYFQYQVLIKPSPDGIQETYLASLEALGIKGADHDSVSSKTTGSPQPSAPGVWAGKCGSTAWR